MTRASAASSSITRIRFFTVSCQGKLHADGRAAADVALDRQFAAMIGGGALYGRPAEAAAMRRGVPATKELASDERDLVGADAAAAVDHFDEARGVIALDVDRQMLLLGRIADRVVDEVVEEQPQRRPIATDVRDVAR